MLKTVTKTVSELFQPENGNSKYTKAYCKEHTGEYIVYSGTTIGIFAKVNFADYNFPNLTFTTDGENAGTIEYITDKGYCIGGHRTILKPKVENIELLYFKFVLQPFFFENVKRGDVPSLHFNNIKDIKVNVPVLSNGAFDLEKQKQLASQYQNIEIQKNNLLNKIKELKNNKVVFDMDKFTAYKTVALNDMFTFSRGNIISKSYIFENQGEYPVYSTQKEIYGYIDNYMLNGKYLLWNTDGLAGYIKIAKGKFSFTNIVGIMKPTGKINMTNISLEYLKCFLEPIFRKHRKGRMGINGKNEYTKLNSTMIKKLDISVRIPVNDSGDYDLEAQKDLARKYATIENIKDSIYKQVKDLTNIIVE